MTEITIVREKLVPAGAHGGYRFEWKWCYSYRVDGGEQSPVFGTSVVELRALLKRRFPGARVVEPWKIRKPETDAVPRPREEIDPADRRRIRRAQTAVAKADAELKDAVVDALEHGASYRALVEATGIANTTIQRWKHQRDA